MECIQQTGNEPLPLTPDRQAALANLLLNSWSAEYTMRLTPLITEADYHDPSLRWSFPHAYWSAFFSIRGILLTHDNPTYSEKTVQEASVMLHEEGLYVGTALSKGFLSELDAARTAVSSVLDDPIGEQQRLLSMAGEVALAHEGYLLAVFRDEYIAIVRATPDYLQESFLTARLKQLLAEQQAVQPIETQLADEKEVATL